jgi:tRNA pseudouridine55 synthase
MPDGLLLVDKPLGISSHGVVSLTRKALNTKKVGHAGTLDPQASGLLVLGVGQATKLLTYCVGLDKNYTTTVRLGYATTTDDAEGDRIEFAKGDLAACTPKLIDHALSAFVGRISQVPSTFSAIKVNGRRAYNLARSGRDVALSAREVTVHSLDRGEIRVDADWIDVDLTISCSSGTYIRAIARDIGEALGVGGHVIALRRTAVGPFGSEKALTTEEISSDQLLGVASAARAIMASVELDPVDVDHVRHGRAVDCTGWLEGQPLAALETASGDLVAIVECFQGRSRILMGIPKAQQSGTMT